MANSSYSNIHPVNDILRNLAIEAIPSDGQLIVVTMQLQKLYLAWDIGSRSMAKVSIV